MTTRLTRTRARLRLAREDEQRAAKRPVDEKSLTERAGCSSQVADVEGAQRASTVWLIYSRILHYASDVPHTKSSPFVPRYWQQHLNNIRAMCAKNDSPVDSMSGEKHMKSAHDDKVQLLNFEQFTLVQSCYLAMCRPVAFKH